MSETFKLRTALRQFDADTGQELADPQAKAAIEMMLKQLLIVLVNRLGGDVHVPVSEVDATSGFLFHMQIVDGNTAFRFIAERTS
jgi:hypothetical protein